MRYRIVAIGQLKRRFYQQGCAFFLERLQSYAKTDMLDIKEAKAKDAAQRQVLESEALLGAASGHLVALDETGRSYSSRRLAERLSELETRSVSSLSLLIGGAEGHSEALRERVDESWRLSDLTLPHDLARLVLLEQLYRAETIRAGHPYHRD